MPTTQRKLGHCSAIACNLLVLQLYFQISRCGPCVANCCINCKGSRGPAERMSSGTQTSFGAILTPIGIVLLVYGFGAFFRLLPGGDISSLMLIYGFPILLLGFALSYAQLRPVPCKTTKAAFDVREGQQTDIQKQVCRVSLLVTLSQKQLTPTTFKRCTVISLRFSLPSRHVQAPISLSRLFPPPSCWPAVQRQ